MASFLGPVVQYNRTPGQYQLNTQPTRLQQSSQLADMEIQTTRPSINVERQRPQVQLDSYENRASRDMKSSGRRIDEEAQRTQQEIREITAQKMDFANNIFHIEKGVTVVDEIYNQIMSYKMRGSLELIMHTPIEVDVTDQSLAINPQRGTLNITTTPHQVSFTHTPGQASFSVLRYPSLTMQFTGRIFDQYA